MRSAFAAISARAMGVASGKSGPCFEMRYAPEIFT